MDDNMDYKKHNAVIVVMSGAIMGYMGPEYQFCDSIDKNKIDFMSSYSFVVLFIGAVVIIDSLRKK